MALFPNSSRYWPENDGEAAQSGGLQSSQPAPTMTLEHLHQLASQRAARRKRAAQCDGKDEEDVDLTSPSKTVHKKKRKKKSHHVGTERGADHDSEANECTVTLSDTEEELKKMKLTDGTALKSDSSKSSKKKKKEEKGGNQSSPLKDLCNELTATDDSAGTKDETKPKKKKKKKKKKKHTDDGHSAVAMAEPVCDNDLDVDKVHQGSQEEMDNAQSKVSDSQRTNPSEEEQSCSQEDTKETVASSDEKVITEGSDVVMPLMPLGHEGRTVSGGTKEKKIVRRQLPQWITDADIIPDDIIEQSRSVDEFSLPEPLVKNLAKIHIDKLFPVQASVIPELLSSQSGPLLTCPAGLPPRDLSVCAPTGCGKTLCYVIPIVSALMDRAVCQVRALVVVPSQELAIQVQRVFDQVAHGTRVRVGVVCGSVSFEKERAMLLDCRTYPPCSCLDIVVATPGRLVEHLDKNSFSTLRHLRYLVIDEADKLLDQHFNQWLPKILSSVETDKQQVMKREKMGGGGIPSLTSLRDTLLSLCASSERLKLMCEDNSHSKEITGAKESDSVFITRSKDHPLSPVAPTSHLQKLLFSATMTQNPEHLASLCLHQPKLFTVASAVQSRGRGGGSLDTAFTLPKELVECTVKSSLEHKPLVLLQLLSSEEKREDMARVLCFTNSKESTHRLCLLLDAFKLVSVGEISSSLGHGKRKAVLDSFKNGKTQVLICSDQMARGMDVEGVTCVVNYDPPRQYQTYLHRAGRTARAGQRGVVFTLLSREEVHPFNTMLRKVGGVKQLQDVVVPSSSLKPLLPQYQSALEQLKLQINSKRS